MRVAEDWYPYIRRGTWPDCDMIPLGHLAIRGERGVDRMSLLTPDEQYSLMTFFTILRSPLMYGGDLPTMDDFTLSLLTNKEVLKMHAEGDNVRQLFRDREKLAVASENPNTGEKYLAIFNISEEEATIGVNLAEFPDCKSAKPVNMWTGEKLGRVKERIEVTLKPHACALYKF